VDYQPDQSLWDTVVFSKLSARLGGRLKLISSGAAPIAGRVAEFLRIGFKSVFAEGYGLTETSAGGTATDYKAVSVCTASRFERQRAVTNVA
jgi:long-subunit acyl-CoA synthetase (AMP-forming)